MTNRAQTSDQHLTSSRSSSSSSIHTQPGVFASLPLYELDRIRQVYNDVLGDLNVAKAEAIEKAVDAGITVDAIIDAIKQTGMARRPSHYYLMAILRRYQESRLYTMDQITADRHERQLNRYIANQKQWSTWYQSPDDDDFPW